MKTKQSITDIDIELDLFDINEWDFSKPFDDNSEYQSWVDDIDLFDIGIVNTVHKLPMVLYGVCFCTVLVLSGLIAYKLATPSQSYLELLALENQTQQQQMVSYVDGEPVTDAEVIDISVLTSTYFNILKEERGYPILNDLCIEDSKFYNEYNASVQQMQYSYDMYDCYARLLKYYGSYCNLNKIQEVLKKDDTYYCYLNVTAPSKKDISGYVKLYSYNFTKHFTVVDFNQANLVRYMYSMEGVGRIPCTQQIVCITLKMDDKGNILIDDDSAILALCTDSYTETLESVSALMGVKIQK